ncbi:hypothetical protein PPO43_09090 [Saprospira sp. CCB-QB6]|uniref:dioxygenase family protein n=1 Tax=Saprospira sp. CCB-QB6 TaxID=3023936 RepID=UPI00234935F4|nr:T9SS type A sorting domain-containing protein [Saprospira sp. CCB-QB6]WCL80131.1 hypothetical protein PPO43_09090 [Saprospira sp. CCB-QB6]
MKRIDFLKRIGLGAVAIPFLGFKDVMDEPSNQEVLENMSCDPLPAETAGPYPAPSSITSSTLLRSDITEGTQTGIPLNFSITIQNIDNNCLAVAGLRVDVWHCNKRGYYSAYDGQPGIDGTVNNAGTTWLRGIQYTDSNGTVNFTSIYPGWYTPRATHIHIQVFDSSNNLLLTSQLAFPDSINSTVDSYYATSGTNSFTNSNDMVFSDSYTDELMTVSGDTTNGYTASKTIGISLGVLGVEEHSLETGGQFSQLKAFPNPAKDQVFFSFQLLQTANVQLNIVSISGQQLGQIIKSDLSAGLQQLAYDCSQLPAGQYAFELVVQNISGTFRQQKLFIKG